MKPVKLLAANISVLILLLAILDILAYFFLPNRFIETFPYYRAEQNPDRSRLAFSPLIAVRASLPKDYFIPHDSRGFDNGADKQGEHWVDGLQYPVWTNNLGCFDQQYDGNEEYIYFAGDSFAWGYTPYADNVGTLLEARSGTRILKCGVVHTGQRHQFEKMREILDRIETLPRAVFVFYYLNDISNDYSHPHTTVLDGWQIDMVRLDSELKRSQIPASDIRAKMQRILKKRLKKQEQSRTAPGMIVQIQRGIKNYSLSANIFPAMMHKIGKLVQPVSPDSIYLIPSERRGRFWYTDNPYAEKNKEAIRSFKQFSNETNIPVYFILIPRKDKFNDTGWYNELRQFLEQEDIDYLDLSFPFRDSNFRHETLYWKIDSHLNQGGNAAVADILLNQYAEIVVSRP